MLEEAVRSFPDSNFPDLQTHPCLTYTTEERRVKLDPQALIVLYLGT